jgi:hypothetical protein
MMLYVGRSQVSLVVADVMWYICNPPSLVRTDTGANDSSGNRCWCLCCEAVPSHWSDSKMYSPDFDVLVFPVLIHFQISFKYPSSLSVLTPSGYI